MNYSWSIDLRNGLFAALLAFSAAAVGGSLAAAVGGSLAAAVRSSLAAAVRSGLAATVRSGLAAAVSAGLAAAVSSSFAAVGYLDGFDQFCTFSIEDDNNEITVGSHTYIYHGTELAAIEGTKITLGADCLLSSDIMIRTGDSHSILDEQGNRINPSGGISIGDHVWIGKGAVVLKNAQIGNNCVIGTGSLVTRSTETLDNAILAGNSTRPIRRNITWNRERIPME